MVSAPACDQIKTGSPLRYLTPAAVAEMLQVDVKTIYRWASSDPSMPVLRAHGVVRFPAARLEQWLVAREQGRRHKDDTRHAVGRVSTRRVSESPLLV